MNGVLLVDDLRSCRDHRDAVVARTAGAALDELRRSRQWDELWLDHDLGHATGVVETALPIVDYLCEAAFKGQPVVVGTLFVHTANPVGRATILRSLTAFGYAPVVVDATAYLISE